MGARAYQAFVAQSRLSVNGNPCDAMAKSSFSVAASLPQPRLATPVAEACSPRRRGRPLHRKIAAFPISDSYRGDLSRRIGRISASLLQPLLQPLPQRLWLGGAGPRMPQLD